MNKSPKQVKKKDLEKIARLIGSIFTYGDFVAETWNERELEKLLRKNGYYPVHNSI